MNISLVIGTCNRGSHLPNLFSALEGLSRDIAFEVVLVDNNSTDDTHDRLRAYASEATIPVRVLREPIQGAGRARNRGWLAAIGEIVVFTDDDCYPAVDYLLQMNKCFEENAALGFVGGRVLLHDQTDLRITIQESTTRRDFPAHSVIQAGVIHGANYAFRRTALEGCNGFDNLLGPGTRFVCEDVDLLARVSDLGWQGAYDPRPVVFHHHRRKSPDDAIRLMELYDRGRGAYYAKCVLQLSSRRRVLKFWLTQIRLDRRDEAKRELAGAVEYCAATFVNRIRSSSG